MPSNRERKLALREKQIMQAAAHLIDRVGYAGLSMDGLAEEVGIAKATLYQHFKNKDEVLVAATLHALTHMGAVLGDGRGRAVEQLRQMMRHMMEAGRLSQESPAIILHDDILPLFRHNPAVHSQFEQVNENLIHLVQTAQAEGDIAEDLPALVVVSLMMTNIGVIKGQMVYEGSLSLSQWIDYTLRVFFDGLKPKPSA
ncbi:MAG: TetR/AcrR family transcriptional regulator [Anaerolineae bacterium]|jgi:AcrR family transcriptional regulator|nr:TetR/AcrR family transcriptional regulator [Anaerolineae bacterium]